ncbi:pirin family protein [Flavobacteriaceae bacterium F08102]|nr:pirin family protein [Flavobacteriaceae bacterium F08102]
MIIKSYPANSRGKTDFGWLTSFHTFSFANYYDPDRLNFGVLRVLNDDTVSGGKGFESHPHKEMEIISIPLEGDLVHRDNLGNEKIIKEGDIQVMSAGTGVVHSEYNRNPDKPVKFLQIWIIPKTAKVTPRYDQLALKDLLKPNQLSPILSPEPTSKGVWIHQDAWFYMGTFDQQAEVHYTLNKAGNGIFLFVISGSLIIDGIQLENRDALGITEINHLIFSVFKNSTLLLMEVPMKLPTPA